MLVPPVQAVRPICPGFCSDPPITLPGGCVLITDNCGCKVCAHSDEIPELSTNPANPDNLIIDAHQQGQGVVSGSVVVTQDQSGNDVGLSFNLEPTVSNAWVVLEYLDQNGQISRIINQYRMQTNRIEVIFPAVSIRPGSDPVSELPLKLGNYTVIVYSEGWTANPKLDSEPAAALMFATFKSNSCAPYPRCNRGLPKTNSCNIADINSDGIVDLRDYSIMSGEFFKTLSSYQADLNCDQVVDLRDYSILSANFLKTTK